MVLVEDLAPRLHHAADALLAEDILSHDGRVVQGENERIGHKLDVRLFLSLPVDVDRVPLPLQVSVLSHDYPSL